jgi:hypothetical protein
MSSNGLGHPFPCGHVICSSNGLSLGLPPLIACGFPWQTFYIPGIANIWGIYCSLGCTIIASRITLSWAEILTLSPVARQAFLLNLGGQKNKNKGD